MGRYFLVIMAVAALLLAACGTGGKAGALRRSELGVGLSLPREREVAHPVTGAADTLLAAVQGGPGSPVPDEPQEPIIMNAVRDENGEMVATDVITAAVVESRFRNIAERHGRVDLEFQVRVPAEMQDSRWQLRFYPLMTILDEDYRLDPVIITGAAYRKSQLRGYQHYQKYLDSIIDDPDRLVYRSQLERFIRRNIPELWRFRADSSIVSEEDFRSAFGVSGQDAIEHYTIGWRVRLNNYRRSRLESVYHRYVKAPIVTEGIRLDTVFRSVTGEFVYNYVQSVAVRKAMKKVDILLEGEIYEQDRRVYTVPPTAPLTFYISSLSQFVDPSPRYLDKVISRRVSANTACYVSFDVGSSVVNDTLGHNSEELGRIRGNLLSLVSNEELDLDSIVVTASASPEGSWRSNAALAAARSQSVSDYCRRYVRSCRDSLALERGFSVAEDGSITHLEWQDIDFVSRSIPEDWELLRSLVQGDDVLTDEDKRSFMALAETGDPDRREAAISALPAYPHIRRSLYPRTRVVRFEFFLHRRGMVKDTVHTTELDTAYMRGVQAIGERDYATAVTILRPYADFNAAVALCAMDYNHSAREILRALEPTPRVLYMDAIIASRLGDEQEAINTYIKACYEDPSLVHRGNLDPEISTLVKKYDIDTQSITEQL